MWHTGTGAGAQVWVQDAAGSAAHVSGHNVWQYGERTLWRVIEQVHAEYAALGCPEHDRFGLTVSPEGQRLWLAYPPRIIEPAPGTLADQA